MARLPKRLNAAKYILLALSSKNMTPKLQSAIMRHCDVNVIKALSEISLNTLKGNLKVSVKTKAKLKKYKTTLRKMACSKTKTSAKRNILVQKGGFLPTLIGVVLSSVLGKLMEKVTQ